MATNQDNPSIGRTGQRDGVGTAVSLGPLAKTLLIIEVFVCFGPALLLLLFGLLLVPMQFYFLFSYDEAVIGAALLIGAVFCGLAGFLTLTTVLGSLLEGQPVDRDPRYVYAGIALGLLPLLTYVTSNSPAWRLVGLLPIAATVHIVYLSRGLIRRL